MLFVTLCVVVVACLDTLEEGSRMNEEGRMMNEGGRMMNEEEDEWIKVSG